MSRVLKLVHLEGTKSGRTDVVDFDPLPDQTLTLGRDPNCILAFDPYKDPRVSAHHADIRWDEDHFWLHDRGSTNGTRVNGLKIFERTKLHHGDEIELGRKGARFRIEFDGDAGAMAAANDKADRNGADGKAAKADDGKDPARDPRKDDDFFEPPDGARAGKADRDKAKADEAAHRSRDRGIDIPADSDQPPLAGDAMARIGRGDRDPMVEAADRATAPQAGSDEEIDVGGGHKVGARTMNMIFANAQELTRKEGGGSLSFFKEVVRQAATQSTTGVKLWLFGLSIVFLVTIIALVVIIILLINQVSELKQQQNSARDNAARPAPVATADNAINERLDDLENRINELRHPQNAVLASNERFHEELVALQERMRQEVDQLRASFDDFAATHVEASVRFQEVERRFRDSVFLIVSRVTLVDPEGNEYRCQSSGTGFIVTPEGLMITNKHVVEPWKFGTVAAQMGHAGLRKLPGSHEILAWPAGAEVLHAPAGQVRSDTAYSQKNRTLRLEHVPADRWAFVEFDDFGSQRVHVANDNSDLAVLRLYRTRERRGEPFEPVPLHREDPRIEDGWRPQKLDNVMAVGFPQGISLFDETRAETSPSLGQIRKFEDTIQISAPIVQGNSGGPVFCFDDQGNPVVIAVATRVISGHETLGICIAIDHALALLDR